jgi:PAS domain S-box-containing protein
MSTSQTSINIRAVLESSLDKVSEGMQIIGSDWKYLYINEAAAAQGKYPRKELLGHTMMEKYPGIEHSETFRVLKECMTTRISRQLENEFTYPDGAKGWFELSIQPVPEGIFVLSMDITKRKRAESEFQTKISHTEKRTNELLEVLLRYTLMDFSQKASISPAGDELDAIAVGLNTLGEELENYIGQLKESEERVQESQKIFSTVFYKSPVINAITDVVTGRYIEVNENFVEFCGFSKEELVGKSSLELNLIPDPEHREEIIKAIKEKGFTRDALLQIKAKNGETKWVSTSAHNVNINGRDCFLTAMVDVSERKKAEEKLQQSEQRFRLLTEGVRDYAIFMVDVNGNIASWNEGAKNIKGYSSEEVMGRHISIFYTPDELERGEPAYNLNMAKEKGRYECEGLRVRKDGSTFLADVLFTSLYDDSGKLQGYAKITRDITEQKIASEKIQQLNNELGQNVDQLQSVNKELEAFTYSVSHDLRAPLRAVNGFAQMLNEEYGPKLDEEAKRILQIIKFNATKMGTLIDELLEFSRLGRKEIQKTIVPMNKLTEEVLALLGKSIPHQAQIKLSHLHPVKGDYGLLQQVMLNLLSNAIKYSSRKEHPVVEIFSEQKDGETIFSVQDNGAGFDMRYANKLFGVFQRLHSQEEFEGTGVGLAIIQRIILKHGGKVWAEGKVNEGATFKFSLVTN